MSRAMFGSPARSRNHAGVADRTAGEVLELHRIDQVGELIAGVGGQNMDVQFELPLTQRERSALKINGR